MASSEVLFPDSGEPLAFVESRAWSLGCRLGKVAPAGLADLLRDGTGVRDDSDDRDSGKPFPTRDCEARQERGRNTHSEDATTVFVSSAGHGHSAGWRHGAPRASDAATPCGIADQRMRRLGSRQGTLAKAALVALLEIEECPGKDARRGGGASSGAAEACVSNSVRSQKQPRPWATSSSACDGASPPRPRAAESPCSSFAEQGTCKLGSRQGTVSPAALAALLDCLAEEEEAEGHWRQDEHAKVALPNERCRSPTGGLEKPSLAVERTRRLGCRQGTMAPGEIARFLEDLEVEQSDEENGQDAENVVAYTHSSWRPSGMSSLTASEPEQTCGDGVPVGSHDSRPGVIAKQVVWKSVAALLEARAIEQLVAQRPCGSVTTLLAPLPLVPSRPSTPATLCCRARRSSGRTMPAVEQDGSAAPTPKQPGLSSTTEVTKLRCKQKRAVRFSIQGSTGEQGHCRDGPPIMELRLQHLGSRQGSLGIAQKVFEYDDVAGLGRTVQKTGSLNIDRKLPNLRRKARRTASCVERPHSNHDDTLQN